MHPHSIVFKGIITEVASAPGNLLCSPKGAGLDLESPIGLGAKVVEGSSLQILPNPCTMSC